MRYGDGEFDYPRQYRLERIEDGFKYFILGFGMKILLADRLAIFWNDMQTIGFASISTPLAWLGMFSYSLRLYFDFWGYSLMAAGVGMMVGFEFIQNFGHPYAARSVSDFYRRWHTTLGSWFRDYIYIPLGGSRAGKGRTVLNLLAVWLLTGIWHGSGWNFCIWGGILGVLIVSEKLWTGRILKRVPLIGNLYVILLIPLTWVVFAISDLKQLGLYFSRLFPFFGQTAYYVNQNDFSVYLQTYGALLVTGLLLCVPQVFEYYEKHKKNTGVILILLTAFWFSVYFVVSQEGNPFMYLRF
jgi:alginate O-acetyltransferase complex protein AlgI